MRSRKIASIGDTDILIHPAFPLIIAAGFMLGHQLMALWMLLVLAVHEASHGLMAKALGCGVSRIELMPFGGLAQVESIVDIQHWKEALIALAGPLSNLLMSMGAAFVVQMGWIAGIDVQTFVRCNLMLMLFNLIPALPLDGGRMAKALLSPVLGSSRTTRLLSLFGMMLGAALLALGVVSLFYKMFNLTFFFTGSYLFYAAAKAREGVVAQVVHRLSYRATRLSRKKVFPIELTAVSRQMPIATLPAQLSSRNYHALVVLGDNFEYCGIIPENKLLDALATNPGQCVQDLLEVSGRGKEKCHQHG